MLRLKQGSEVVLFDGLQTERLYKITELSEKEAHLELVTDYELKKPRRDVYLLWSLLKKDKNDWVLQKGTELGVSHFLPLLADRSEKTGFNLERARKIVIEAAEQCGRSDIPNLREPMLVKTAIEEFDGKVPMLVCDETGKETETNLSKAAILIGPEGGWSDKEKLLFKEYHLAPLILHDFTLRAETAAVAAIAKLL